MYRYKGCVGTRGVQPTRWWLCWLGTSRTTQTRPLPYLETPTPTATFMRDPTTRLENKLINTFKDIKQEDSVTQPTGKCIQPVLSPQKFMAFLKYTKLAPLRPIISGRGSLTYEVAKELASIICPLVGQSPHHLKNTQHFIQQIQKARLVPGEVMTSYNVMALFTSVPVDPSIQIVNQKLQHDPTSPHSTNISIPHVVTLS